MCGITGAVGGRARSELAACAVRALAHRGPDATDLHSWSTPCGPVVLGHTRLAINDLTDAGRQPVLSEDGRLALVFNGEIYNYPDLREECERRGHRFSSRMDGEAILHLYELDGIAAFNRLNGIFALAIMDIVSGEVVLARDPLGVKPLFFNVDDGGLTFASEIGALLEFGVDPGGEDTRALAQFLTFLWVPAPATPLQRIRSLRPGECLSFVHGNLQLRHYADPLYSIEPLRISAAEAVRQCGHLFAAATRRQLLSDVPLALMASGGIDSGLIWSNTHDSLDRAFTIAWSGDAEGLEDDLANARLLQHRFKTPLIEIEGQQVDVGTLPRAGDLFADPAFVLARVIARSASEAGIKVLFSGQGGDELFGGYRRHRVAALLGRAHGVGAAGMTGRLVKRWTRGGTRTEYATRLLRAVAEKDAFAGYMQLSTYSVAADRAAALGTYEAEVSDEVVWSAHREVFDSLPASMSFARRARLLDLLVYLPGLGLAYVDRAGMEAGVEVRVPWLDLDLVRWATSLPDDVLMHRRQSKWITRTLAAEQCGARYSRAPKRGFGAPASQLRVGQPAGARGFRQGQYFALARHLLGQYRQGMRAT